MKSLQFESFSPFAASSVVYSDPDSDRWPKTLISLNIAEQKRALCRKRSHKDAEGSIEKAVAEILGIEKSDMLASAGGRA